MEFPLIIYSEQKGLQYVSYYVDLQKYAPYTIVGVAQTPETWQLVCAVAREAEKAQTKLPWYKRLWPSLF